MLAVDDVGDDDEADDDGVDDDEADGDGVDDDDADVDDFVWSAATAPGTNAVPAAPKMIAAAIAVFLNSKRFMIRLLVMATTCPDLACALRREPPGILLPDSLAIHLET